MALGLTQMLLTASPSAAGVMVTPNVAFAPE
jgi:hypothetical protein